MPALNLKGFPKIGGSFLRVSIVGITICWVLFWNPPSHGNYHKHLDRNAKSMTREFQVVSQRTKQHPVLEAHSDWLYASSTKLQPQCCEISMWGAPKATADSKKSV